MNQFCRAWWNSVCCWAENAAARGLKFAAVTTRDLRQRYDMDPKTWCEFVNAKVVFERQRNISLEGVVTNYDAWYVVQFQRD